MRLIIKQSISTWIFPGDFYYMCQRMSRIAAACSPSFVMPVIDSTATRA